MSSEACLPLLLDAPMQSWGFASRFQRRTTGLFPTKSGVVGMICAAMGLAKGSPEEREWLPRLARLRMTVIVIPRREIRRLEDFHTVGAGYDPKTQELFITRTASDKPNVKGGKAVAVVTHRQYLLDARFGVLLEGDRELLEQVAGALRDPVWGVWFGRKCCIPAAPLLAEGVATTREQAWSFLARAAGLSPSESIEKFEPIEETSPSAADDTLLDLPVSFGDATSSGPDKRVFTARYVRRKADHS